MTDDKNRRDLQDRDRVSGAEDYEVELFAQQHGVTAQQVRNLIAKFGNRREDLVREAKRLKA